MNYSIWIVRPPTDAHAHTRCFDEIALSLQAAFGALGHEVPIVYKPQDATGKTIVLGTGVLHEITEPLPDDMILYNFEQVHDEARFFRQKHPYINFLRRYPVWDYSRNNVTALRARGVENVTMCGVGYMPELSRIEHAAIKDIDVLFIGTLHPRRQHILDELMRRKLRVEIIKNKYGAERDEMIARSKVVINIHLQPASIFEIVRVSYLLANKVCVISESGEDHELEAPFTKAVVFRPYEELVDACLEYVVDAAKRKKQADAGLRIFSKMTQTPMLAGALDGNSSPRRGEARRGADFRDAKIQGKNAPTPALPLRERETIFINIASYRDPECQWTVKDLFEKAAHPERVNVGICWQYDPKEDAACFEVDYPRPEQVRAVQFHHRDSQGANWARAQAFTLYQGETHVLVIDSHMRFEKGWDELLLDALKRCAGEKAMVTGWLPGYKPPRKLEAKKDQIPRLRVFRLESEDEAQLVNLSYFYAPAAKVKGHMEPSCSCVANFTFGPAAAFKDVPFDPYIDFWGDEINQSARLWTHGWDFFQIDRRIAYHYWDPENIKGRNSYRDRKLARHQRARTRNLHLFGIQRSNDAAAIAGLDKYPLGTARPMKDYWQFMGVDLATKTIQPHGAKGEWNLLSPPLEGGGRGRGYLKEDTISKIPPLPNPPPQVGRGKSTIFVNIASYRDPETRATVKDLFEKAAHPERIHVGICLQVDAVEDKKCMVGEAIRPGQVRIRQGHYKDSGGANWARHQAQLLWQGEEYVLQIDSHMRFEQGWDEALIEMLGRAPSENAVLSTYVPRYTPPNNREKIGDTILRVRVHMFGEEKSPQLLHLTRASVPLADRERSGLYVSPFYVANFMFCRADVLQQIPFDPHISFWGDEITYSARLWTHGVDVYQPDRVVAYHYWRRDELVPIQPYRRINKRSLVRVKHVLEFERTDDAKALVDMEHYGLGNKRSLKDLWAFAGVDWQKRTIAKDALEGRWKVPLRLVTGDSGSRGRWPLVRDVGKTSIFVNIASYRDPECQWTVKDLFEKATNPDRINVGICWQFDPQKDQDCFQVSTRPDQVRMLPVDWREAEGVCWARSQTQRLWDGEDYTLMIDSHMRFVPGWDELMIRELAECESDKPLLSCSPAPYVPPNRLAKNLNPTIRRVKPFFPDGNIRCQGEMLERVPEKPLRGAFMVANFAFSRANVIEEVPYDPYLYFDQEEITYAARLYTHGWDVFSARQQFLYHFYNDGKVSKDTRPLHWNDLRKEDEKKIIYLKQRGLNRFNHMTGHRLSDNPEVTKELDRYGFGRVRSIAEFEEYSGVDFKRKIATEKALRCLFIKDLHKYTKGIYVPELDGVSSPLRGEARGGALSSNTATAPTPTLPLRGRELALEPGDFIPFFEATDTEHKLRGMEIFGGKHCMLFFLPADNGRYVADFFNHFNQQLVQAKHKNVWNAFILDDTAERLIALKERIGIRQSLWADPGRKIAQAFGLWRPGEKNLPPSGYVLNNNLRVVRRSINVNAQKLAVGIVDDCQAEITKHVDNTRKPRVISEVAPALIIPDAFTPELCKKCIDAFHNGRTFDGTVGAEEKTGYRPSAKVRTDHIISGPLLGEIDEKFSRSVFPEIKKVFGLSVKHRELYKVGLYKGDKGGFFRQHRDNFEIPLAYRRVAMTLHLNDDYEGGGLRFPEYGNDVYRPAVGSGIAFSCSTVHEARPVTSGERYILVCFFHGDEEEAFRRYYLAGKGSPLRIKDYTAQIPLQPDIPQSRDFVRQWEAEHVSFAKSDAVAQAQLPVMVNTIGNHQPKKVFESPQGIIFDDFLPEDVYTRLRDFAVKTSYEYVNTKGKVPSAWHIHDGFPLRSMDAFYYADAAAKPEGKHVYPTNTGFDAFIDHLMAMQLHVQHLTGKALADWQRFSVTSWLYPPGSGLSLHDDGAGVYSGAYTYFLNPAWRPHWGGLLMLMDGEGNRAVHDHRKTQDVTDFYKRKWLHENATDELLMEQGLAKCIMPKKNRIVFIANDAYHMITRVNESAGDNARMSIAGFFHKKK